MESTVKERIKLFLKTHNIKAVDFCDTIGVSSGFISGMRESIQPDKLKSIAINYPTLDISWLLTGIGEMLKDNPQEVQCDECSIIRERICKLLEYVGLNPSSLSINPIIQQKLNRQINGNGALSADIIYIVLEKIPFSSAEWLLRGEGEMLNSSSTAETNKASLIEELKGEINRLKGENRVLRELNGLGERKDRSAS